jgi:hypothetical protein
MDEPTRTLAEMISALKTIPRRESERLMDMGDGNMLMPIAMFEHYVYSMTYLRAYLEEMHEEKPAGGVECALIYLFFMQHQALPHDRTEDKIMLLPSSCWRLLPLIVRRSQALRMRSLPLVRYSCPRRLLRSLCPRALPSLWGWLLKETDEYSDD